MNKLNKLHESFTTERFNKFDSLVEKGRSICFERGHQERYYHIAYLIKGRRVINYSRNNYNRQFINGKIATSLHAEIGCMKFLKDNKRIKKGFSVLILRYNKHNGSLCDSKPCNNCKQFLIKKGLTKIYCSTSDGTIQKFKPEDISEYYSVAWKKLIGNKPIVL
jgi:deoxycytidylate deaminase